MAAVSKMETICRRENHPFSALFEPCEQEEELVPSCLDIICETSRIAASFTSPALRHRSTLSSIAASSKHADLSRLPSMSSIIAPSDMTSYYEDDEPPATPKATPAAPTTPAQRPISSGGLTTLPVLPERPRSALSLKEQNAKIDQLTKENFDLKLKIHFLDQALQTRSEEGVQTIVEQNVQLQTDLANERKESQTMRRKMRNMEQKIQEQAEALADAQKLKDYPRDDDEDPTLQAEMHEEILYLRQQLDHSENQVTTLRDEVMTRELEKRKMSEGMRAMANKRGEDTAGMKETLDMWQDLLSAETGRREQAEEDVSKIRDELNALKLDRATPSITKATKTDRRRSRLDSTQSPGADAESDIFSNSEETESKALVEQLKHENAELRRDLGAQTSMLTSRNRERERLQQEIEDLKLLQRKSDGARSVAGESIFDRSISRAHQRSQSRTSDHTQVTEVERDGWHKKEGELRDANAELRLKYQELEETHSKYMTFVSALEEDFTQMENELKDAREDLVTIQAERDEALNAYEEAHSQNDDLKEEAWEEIRGLEQKLEKLEGDLVETRKQHQKTKQKLQTSADDYKGLQGELRNITQSVMNLEDLKQHNMRTIQTLETQMSEAEDEIQKWEQKCNELDQKNRKLEISQESLHSEVNFLREEQEGDKIKIGELEDALNAAQQTIQDEQEKLREMGASMREEREQRDALENKSKEEVQKILDDLNNESARTKDEVRKLRRALSAKEVEASGWKQKLEELEQALRQTLGDADGTKPSLLASIEKLQRDLEQTESELDKVKMNLSDKDRLLRHREGIWESTSLESRRLSDLLEKERSSRRHDLDQFEKATRGQATHIRTIAQQESRVLELETAYSQSQRKLGTMEQQQREQLHERNMLLLALWNRLSTLCGQDWAQQHALINGQNPSVEVIGRNQPAFNKNLISAVKTIEALLGSFKVRIRSIEKDLWRDYQTLEHNLDMRVRRMDALEQAVEEAQRAFAEEVAQRPQTSRTVSIRNGKGSEEISKLKSEVKLLKSELKFHRQHPSAMAQQMINQQAQTNPEHARRLSSASPARQIVQSLLRHHSTSAVEQVHSSETEVLQNRPQSIVLAAPSVQPSEQRWTHRLKEMERRLKAEREARLLDRRGARQRLEEAGKENEELRAQLGREAASREDGSSE